MGPPPSSSNLDSLLAAWGLEFDTSKVVADRSFAREIAFQRGAQPQMQPCFLFVDEQGINSSDVVTSQTDQLMLPFPGGFTGTPAEGLKQTVLLHSTEQSQLVDAFMARLSGEQVLKDFKPSDKEYALAMRLTGQFKTAFRRASLAPQQRKRIWTAKTLSHLLPRQSRRWLRGPPSCFLPMQTFSSIVLASVNRTFSERAWSSCSTAMCLWCRHR